MQPSLVILSINPQKAERMIGQAQARGLNPVVHWGQTPTETPNWPARYGGAARSLAIIRSYRSLLQHLPDAPGWYISQDDIQLPDNLETDGFTVFGNRRTSQHVCPWLFYLPASKRDLLLGCWRTETKLVCETWQPLTRRLHVPNTVVNAWP